MPPIADLPDLLRRHAPSQGLTATPIARVAILRREAPSRPVHGTYAPLLCIVAQGSKHVDFGAHSMDVAEGEMIVTAAEVPVAGQVTRASQARPFLAVSVDFELDVVAELAASVERDGGTAPGEHQFSRSTPQPAVLDAVTRLLDLLDTPEHIPVLAPLVRREITYRILTGPAGVALRALAPRATPNAAIRRVAAWIKDHPAHAVRIPALAAMAHMSVAAFHRNFRDVTSLTPLQFQKRMRLHEARRLLLARADDAAGAAHRVGYESVSQFSREYRRLFGAPPARDVAEAWATESRRPACAHSASTAPSEHTLR